jgi:hypothetical protein
MICTIVIVISVLVMLASLLYLMRHERQRRH